MEHNDIEEFILDYCNDLTAPVLIEICSIMDTYNYSEWYTSLVEIRSNIELLTISNVGVSINKSILNHSLSILETIGLSINEDDNINIYEVRDILKTLNSFEDLEISTTYELLDMFAIEDDSILLICNILEKLTIHRTTRLYGLIDSLELTLLDNIEKILINNTKLEKSDSLDKGIIEVIKYISDGNNAVLNIANSTDKTYSIILYIKTYLNKNYFLDNAKKDAIDIMSFLLLAKDSRNKRLDTYIEYVENVIDNEIVASKIYNELKLLDEKVLSYISKHNLNDLIEGSTHDKN